MCHTALQDYRFLVVVAHRRWGKTECAISSLLVAAMTCQLPDGMYAYIAPYLKQAKAIAWRKLKRMIVKMFGRDWKAHGVEKNESELWVQFPNGARIQLFGADNADAMRGLYLDGAVLDEIADFKSEVWNGVIRPALADRLGWAMFIGTPKGMNELYKFYQRGLDSDTWKSLIFSVVDTDLPWLPKKEIEALQEDMTESMFAQEMLCDFQASSDDILFKLATLHTASKVQLKLSDLQGCAKIIGLDVAGPGKDKTSLAKQQGLMLWPVETFKIDETPDICDMLASKMVEWGADAAIVDKGRGFAVVEQMHRRGFHNVYGVDFGGKAIMPQYANKKTEMCYRTLKKLKEGMKIPADPELFAEMSAHKVKLSEARGSGGKLIVSDKDTVKEILKRSPDKFDSVMLCNAFDVMPIEVHPLQNPAMSDKVTLGGHLLHNHQAQDYDPYQNGD